MLPIIEVRAVAKHFRQHRRFPGFLGTLRALVTREYTDVPAVDGVTFNIAAGEAVGYLGPNGAGKSTMIKMLTGILVPTAGDVTVLGRIPHRQRTINAREIGVVFGQRSQLWWDLPVVDSFTLHRHIYDIPEARYRENLAYMSELLGLTPFLDRAVRQLSLGQRMRAEIAMALLHDPKVLFLDEPTIGLDVVAKHALRKFLAQMNRERGVTIILTTHDLQDIEEICPRLIMVDEGKLLYDGGIRGLRAALGSARRLMIEFSTDPGTLTLSAARLVSDEGAVKHFLIDDGASLVDIIGDIGPGRGLKDVSLEEPGIEELIRTFYQQRADAVV